MFALCARRITREATQADIEEINREIQALLVATEAGCDERTYKAMTNEISSRMYGVVNNRYLRDMMMVLRQKMFWHYCYLGTSTQERRRDSNTYWARLQKALAARDAAAAEEGAYAIMNASKEFALQLLE